jgi:hypothetical protein
MKQKFRLYRRKASGRYYAQDNATGQQESLGTSHRTEALRLICAKNEAEFQPAFNAHLARTYLSAGDPESHPDEPSNAAHSSASSLPQMPR